MIDSMRSCRLAAFLIFSILVLTASGCSNRLDKKGSLFEPDQVNAMLFRFDRPLELFGTALPGPDIAARIASNLSQWDYPITAEDSGHYSHTITIVLGPITHGSTPAGFSFSSGNSDPRALDFQKADVLPVTCSLIPKNQPEQSAELTLVFSAKEYLDFAEADTPRSKLIDLLVDDGSTVCFNLLRELKVNTKPKQTSEHKTQPGWFPEIRVEVENEPGAEDSELPPTEQKPESNERRKRIVIHNQGSPVIFKFGHERK
ncbi:MAG: hypothetical protein ACU83N_09215 [Gammaproteobacteria bacterium]